MGVRLRKTPALLAVLECLLYRDKPYGLEIIDQTGLPNGTVYPILARLEGEGFATSYWETDEPDACRPRKRFYEVTSVGSAFARYALAERPPTHRRTTKSRPAQPGLAGGDRRARAATPLPA
jgi:PadR family transcriptional regulator, regulatory protein PadR